DRRTGDFDGRGRSLPGELLAPVLTWSGVPFALGPLEPGAANAATCRGQRLALPEGGTSLYLLAASARGEARGEIRVAGAPQEVRFRDWSARIGRADRRRWGRLEGGFLRRERIAWVGTHRHGPRGDEPYVFCYLYAIGVALPESARELELPVLPNVRL